jgi:hypothetical protein
MNWFLTTDYWDVFYYCFMLFWLLVFVIVVARWIINDASKRGKSPFLVFIACVFFFPWGLIAWLVFRPDPIKPPGDGFNLTDYRSQ